MTLVNRPFISQLSLNRRHLGLTSLERIRLRDLQNQLILSTEVIALSEAVQSSHMLDMEAIARLQEFRMVVGARYIELGFIEERLLSKTTSTAPNFR